MPLQRTHKDFGLASRCRTIALLYNVCVQSLAQSAQVEETKQSRPSVDAGQQLEGMIDNGNVEVRAIRFLPGHAVDVSGQMNMSNHEHVVVHATSSTIFDEQPRKYLALCRALSTFCKTYGGRLSPWLAKQTTRKAQSLHKTQRQQFEVKQLQVCDLIMLHLIKGMRPA